MSAEGATGEEFDHTYAFLKTGSGNRYLKYADIWGGFYIGFGNFPLDVLGGTYEEAAKAHPALRDQGQPEQSYFRPLQEIYRVSLAPWRDKVRFAVWDRDRSRLELWQATDQLRPFPRKFAPQLFNDCATEAELSKSSEWRQYLKDVNKHIERAGLESDPCGFVAGSSGKRFLPARRICEPIESEMLYAPIDTLSVLQQLNRRTFAYMTGINPPGVPWPDGIFEKSTVFLGPDGPTKESGYGRFVREYLDRLVDPACQNSLTSLTYDQRMMLVCATVNPLLVETATMLFALDIGMVIDSGRGKGRQGIDVVAACGRNMTPGAILENLDGLGISLPIEAVEHFRQTQTLSFQCKGYDGPLATSARRLIEFRPFASPGRQPGVSLLHVLRLARDPENTGFRHLNAWLDRMCSVVVGDLRPPILIS